MLRSIICPVSTVKVDNTVVRLTGFAMAGTLACFIISGSFFAIAFVVVDYFIRSLSSSKSSPASRFASEISKFYALPSPKIDKAPKLFAARVGFILAFSSMMLLGTYPLISFSLAGVLAFFALLESVLNFCVGCLLYTLVYRAVNDAAA